MNLVEIVNSVISGLTCTVIIALSTFLFKIIKKSHNKNKELFWNRIFFYVSLFGIVNCAIFFRIDECTLHPFSFGNSYNSFNFICLVINIISVIFHYHDSKNY